MTHVRAALVVDDDAGRVVCFDPPRRGGASVDIDDSVDVCLQATQPTTRGMV